MDTPSSAISPELTSLVGKAGLNESQSKAYLALIEYGKLTPVELAGKTGESRTNGYMLAEKLEKLGLATKKDGKKTIYLPNHPSSLEALIERRRKIIMRNEQELKSNLSPLVDMFFAHTEAPGTRTLQGIDGIKEVYADTLRAQKDIFLLRTTADEPDLGIDYLNEYRQKRALAGIHTYALTPVTETGIHNQKSGENEKMLFHRTFLPEKSYTAPVEIDVYGHKVALISFGATQMATTIDSPAIAEAMRQILMLLSTQLQQVNHDDFLK